MLIHTGAYHFWPKPVAFRNDYCLTCQAAGRSVATRTFDVGHVFWVPVLPVGFWKHWSCLRCGADPHMSPRTRRSFQWVGLAILILLSVIFWMAPVEPEDAWMFWLFRVGAPFGGWLLLRHLLIAPKTISLRQGIKLVMPANDTVCPFCSTPLLAGPRWSCPACGVVRY